MKLSLVDNWRTLWKSWTVQLSALGVLLPDLLQILADNTALFPWLDDGYKSGIRLAFLLLIPVVRALKQPPSLAP